MSTGEGLRKRRTRRFVQVDRVTVRDGRISFRALGALAWLLDRPEGWDVRAEQMSSSGDGREGRDAVRTALRELAIGGYYRLERRRLINGRFAMGTAVSEEPVPSWAEQAGLYDGRAVPVTQQADGSFVVIYPDGSARPDDFPVDDDAPAVVDNETPGETEDCKSGSGSTEDGIPGSGFPTSVKPTSVFPAPKEELRRETSKERSPSPLPARTDLLTLDDVGVGTGGGEGGSTGTTPASPGLDALVAELHGLQPGWTPVGIEAALVAAVVAGRTPEAVARAAREIATGQHGATRGSLRNRLLSDGPWWNTPSRGYRPTAPLPRSRQCPKHQGESADNCGPCRGEARGVPDPPVNGAARVDPVAARAEVRKRLGEAERKMAAAKVGRHQGAGVVVDSA